MQQLSPTLLAMQETFRRHTIAQVAFVLVIFQLILLTQLWWKPDLVKSSLGSQLFSLEHLPLTSSTPLLIQVKEITQHPTQKEYWNIKIDILNNTDSWTSYPHLILSFLDEQKKIVVQKVWSPTEYMVPNGNLALAPHAEKHLNLWLHLPSHVPSEYNLDYFFPY